MARMFVFGIAFLVFFVRLLKSISCGPSVVAADEVACADGEEKLSGMCVGAGRADLKHGITPEFEDVDKFKLFGESLGSSVIVPAITDFKEVDYAEITDVIRQSLLINKKLKDWTWDPFPPKGAGGLSVSAGAMRDRYERLPIDRTERVNTTPEPMGGYLGFHSTVPTSANFRCVAESAAQNSFGVSRHNPVSQLTEFATGDLMTVDRPINELYRPEMVQELQKKAAEGEFTWIAPPTEPILGGRVMFDEMRSTKYNGEVAGREPMPAVSGGPQTSLYWQSSVPDRHRRGVNETEMYQAGNPLNYHTKDHITRDTYYRPKEEPLIPNTVTSGFWGNHKDPLADVSNTDKSFYASSRVHPDEPDNCHNIRDDPSDRNTRGGSRTLPSGVSSHGNHDAPMTRAREYTRTSSNKVVDNTRGADEITREMLATPLIGNPQDRSASHSNRRQIETMETYRPHMSAQQAYALDRRDMLSVGPATHGRV